MSFDTREAVDRAVVHHRAGRINAAETIYRQVLARDPYDFDALHLLGMIALQCGRADDAIELIDRALQVKPTIAEAHCNRGDACRAAGRPRDAEESYLAAIALRPNHAEMHSKLGMALVAQGRIREAAERFEVSVACDRSYVAGLINLGNAYSELGRNADAIARYEEALRFEPENAFAHIVLGRALQRLGRVGDALAMYQEGLAIDSSIAYGHLLLGHLLHEQGMISDALECFESATKLEPQNVDARWALTMSQLALVHESNSDAEDSRNNFSKALNDLDEWLNDPSRAMNAVNVVGNQQPFYIAYYEVNNRDLLSRYGDICSRITSTWQTREGIEASPKSREDKIRVGIVSAQVRNHSVWHAIVKGWLRELDSTKFSLHMFHLGAKADDETAYARSRVESFVQAPKSMREWVDAVSQAELDVLIYPEIGMDGATLKLASMRLANVQMAAWGHPETSGLPTIDYYLSAEDFEPPAAQANYREKLVSLPHLGCCYHPLAAKDVAIDLPGLGIDSAIPILLCPGVPFKYAPKHDWIFVDLAKRLKKCQLVFFLDRRENLSATLERRLELAFEQEGLFFQTYGVFVPWLERDEFFALMKRATVYLDTIGFSGFNTAMQAIQCGLPVVTRDGHFMRGRLASGILRRMEMPELIAHSEHEYVELASRLSLDHEYNVSIREQIGAKRDALFEDTAPIRALESFLIGVSRTSGHGPT